MQTLLLMIILFCNVKTKSKCIHYEQNCDFFNLKAAKNKTKKSKKNKYLFVVYDYLNNSSLKVFF